MTVLFESGYSLPGGDEPISHARIAHSGNWNAGGTITASTSATDFPASAADNSLTYEKWQPTALPATWETVITSTECDYCLIAGHNMGTQGNTLQVQVDTGGGYTDLISTAITSDSPIYVIFEPETATDWRIRISNGSVPSIAVIRFGQSLQMERPFFGGFAPLEMNRQSTYRSNRSETGEWLGKSLVRSRLSGAFSWQNLSSAWVRSDFDPFLKAIREEPFGIAWRPETGYLQAYYCQMIGMSPPTNTGIRDLMEASVEVDALAYE